MLVEFAAVAACAVLARLAVVQGALIGGAPFGRLAWGGQHDVLPGRLRIGSALSIVLCALFGYTAQAKAGFVPALLGKNVKSIVMWVLTAYFALSVVMNAISRSKPERLTMTPTALVLAILYLILAIG